MRCRVVKIAVVQQDQGAMGKSFCMTMRLPLRKGCNGGTGRSWCKYVMASAVAMVVDIVGVAIMKLYKRSIMVQNSGQRLKTTK